MENDVDSVVCPECGGDVCVVHDTARGWTHRSRVLPRVAWAVVCLGLIGYWVSIGQWSFVQNMSPPSQRAQMPIGHPRISTLLNPSNRVGSEVSYISVGDLHDAIGGDAEAFGRVIDKIGEAGTQDQRNRIANRVVESVVFGWKEPYGNLTSNRSYFAGGLLVFIQKNTMMHDITDRDSVGINMLQGKWRSGGWSLYPKFGHSSITHDGAVIRSWNVSLIAIFGAMSVSIVLAWLIALVIGWIGGRFGITILKKNRFRWGMFLMLSVTACVLCLSHPAISESVWGYSNEDIAQSRAYTMEQLGKAKEDESKMIALCQSLLDLLPDGVEDSLLLGQSWNYQAATKQSLASPVVDRFSLSLRRNNPIVYYEKRAYNDISDGEKIPLMYRPSFWNGIRDRGIARVQWGPSENQKLLSVGVFQLISIGVLFWLIWRVFHGMSRFVFGRIQKRRVLRNQCIFCAYPLSEEARNARSLGIGS